MGAHVQSSKQDLIRNCRHIMPTGSTCQSPAMLNSAYCYHHARLHRHYPPPQKPRNFPQLQALDSRRAIQVAITEVLNGLLSRKIDPRQAGRALYGIQIVSQTVNGATFTQLTGLAKRMPDNTNSTPPKSESAPSAQAQEDSSTAPTTSC